MPRARHSACRSGTSEEMERIQASPRVFDGVGASAMPQSVSLGRGRLAVCAGVFFSTSVAAINCATAKVYI